VPSSSIVVFDPNPAPDELVRSTLTRAGYAVTHAADPEALFRLAPDRHLIVLDPGAGDPAAPELTRDLRAHPALATVPVLCISETDDVEVRIRLLEAGADDVVAKPFDARELEARAEALLLRFQRSRDLITLPMPGEIRRGRRIVAVFSPKGGVGTTTIAVNAAILAAQLYPNRAVLVDLDLQFGQVATHLNIAPSHALIDLPRDDDGSRDVEQLLQMLEQHESGLYVLPAPGSPELAQLVTARQIERLISGLAESFEALVIDAGSLLDERTLAALELAEKIIVPITAELGSLKALSTMLDYLGEIGSLMSKASFVLNNVFAKELLRSSDIEGALGTKIAHELPYDPLVYLKAVNEGVPVLTGAPKSSAADRLAKIAGAALGPDKPMAPAPAVERRRGFGLLRRGA
jgi:pilus assembly protein CpaE